MDGSSEKHRDLMERIAEHREEMRDVFEAIKKDLNSLDKISEDLQKERLRVLQDIYRMNKLEKRIQDARNMIMLKRAMVMYSIYKKEKEKDE